ncbi:hypothetical protein ACTG9Q_23410 [Actinokineospora sp. 24-640]
MATLPNTLPAHNHPLFALTQRRNTRSDTEDESAHGGVNIPLLPQPDLDSPLIPSTVDLCGSATPQTAADKAAAWASQGVPDIAGLLAPPIVSTVALVVHTALPGAGVGVGGGALRGSPTGPAAPTDLIFTAPVCQDSMRG